MDLGLAGKNAVVTGGSRGIGRAIALGLAGEGANIAFCARGAPALEKTRAELEALDVRVYAVAIGRQGLVPYPVDDPIFGQRTRQVETKIDLALLEKISAMTGGRMFQATNPEALQDIFDTIDELETARYETRISTWYRERMVWFAGAALLLLLIEELLAATWLRKLP